jgi:hypothetical protein
VRYFASMRAEDYGASTEDCDSTSGGLRRRQRRPAGSGASTGGWPSRPRVIGWRRECGSLAGGERGRPSDGTSAVVWPAASAGGRPAASAGGRPAASTRGRRHECGRTTGDKRGTLAGGGPGVGRPAGERRAADGRPAGGRRRWQLARDAIDWGLD